MQATRAFDLAVPRHRPRLALTGTSPVRPSRGTSAPESPFQRASEIRQAPDQRGGGG